MYFMVWYYLQLDHILFQQIAKLEKESGKTFFLWLIVKSFKKRLIGVLQYENCKVAVG